MNEKDLNLSELAKSSDLFTSPIFDHSEQLEIRNVGARNAVVGYLPEWRHAHWHGDEEWRWEKVCQHVTHLLLFSLEVSPKGTLTALDRFPPPKMLRSARAAADKHGTRLLLSLGGNGRTNGFARVAISDSLRATFVQHLVRFVTTHGLDGVDYNWEYPQTEAEWHGLQKLVHETRLAFDAHTTNDSDKINQDQKKDQNNQKKDQNDQKKDQNQEKDQEKNQEKHNSYASRRLVISVAYYPDSRQERILAQLKIDRDVDIMCAMSYDQPGEHSTIAFAKQVITQAQQLLGGAAAKVVLGVPFYARHERTMEWRSYDDIAREFHPAPDSDNAQSWYFNGPETMRRKVALAQEAGLAGIMVWELGQDCFDNSLQDFRPEALLPIISAQQHLASDPSLSSPNPSLSSPDPPAHLAFDEL